MENSNFPDVTRYSRLSEYLTDYAAAKKRQNPRWTYAVWSRQLRIPRLATLTRVVHGDRSPGEPIIEAMISYFRFDPVRSEYFRTLVMVSHPNLRDEFARMFKRRLGELSLLLQETLHKKDPNDPPVLSLREASLLTLWGNAPLDSANQVLEPYGLEAVPVQGRAQVGIVVAHYPDSNLGTYSESYVAILSKQLGRGVLSASVFFRCLVNTSARLATILRMHWGLDYAAGSIALAIQSPTPEAAVEVEGAPWLQFKLGSSAFPFSPNEEKAAFNGMTCDGESLKRYKLCVRGEGRKRAFDPVNDVFSTGSGMGAMISAMGFKPMEWAIFDRMDCEVFPPFREERRNPRNLENPRRR